MARNTGSLKSRLQTCIQFFWTFCILSKNTLIRLHAGISLAQQYVVSCRTRQWVQCRSYTDAKEELNEVIQDIIDRSLDGLDPINLFDSMTDSFADSIISGEADPDSIGDILYEYAETFTDPVIEFVDSALDKLADLGVSSDFISDVEGHIADIFEQIDGPFENTLSGEYEGITFTPAEDISGNDFEFSRVNDLEMSGIDQFQAFDSVTGDEFFGQNDLSSDLGYMENTAEDFMNDSLTDVEMDICQSINDVMNNLTDQGIDIDSADNQVLWDSIQDQITNDAVNGMDIRDPDYIQSTADESMHLVDKMNDGLNDMDQMNDVDFSHSNDTSYKGKYKLLCGLRIECSKERCP